MLHWNEFNTEFRVLALDCGELQAAFAAAAS
jgi:hypothetical protein